MKTEKWMEDVRANCERCYDEKDETSQAQVRILDQRRRGGSLVVWRGRKLGEEQGFMAREIAW